LIDLGLAHVPKVQNRYRHMLAEDIEIWRRFVFNGDYLPDVVWYDVRCGHGVRLSDVQPDWMKRMALGLTRKRIDVVGRIGMDYWIIEVKPRASYDAFGQVVFYADAFEKEHQPAGQVYPVLVTDQVDPDILSLCDEVGVLVVEVGSKEKGRPN